MHPALSTSTKGTIILERFPYVVFTPMLLGGCAQAVQPPPVPVAFIDVERSQCLEAVERFRSVRGVRDIEFDMYRVRAMIRSDARATTNEQVSEICDELGITCRVQTDDHGRYVERTQFPAGLDVAWLTQSGESVDLEASAVPGRVTVFDFYATWCENCRVVDEMMIDYMSQHPDVAYRKINVVDWESPAGKAFLGDVAALPYLIIYDRNAKRVDAIVGLKPKHILERLDAARVPAPQRNGSE